MADINFGTQAVWAGEGKDFANGSTQAPIIQTVSFGYRDIDEWIEVAREKREGYIYSRNNNPTVRIFEKKIAALEGAETALAFSTGMAAISNTLYTLLKPGDRVVSQKDTYGGTSKIFMEFLPRLDIDVTLCETGNHEEMESEIKKGCTVLYLETPTNPTMKIMDLERCARAGHDCGAVVIADNTFATPINTNPISLGVDLVIHSATKYLGGHADVLGGAVAGPEEILEKIYHYREINGSSLHPISAYFFIRSMKTLQLRVNRQCENAMKIAQFLETHPNVEKVFYPGLPSHPGHDIAKKQMRAYSGMLSFQITSGLEGIKKMLPELTYAHLAANLGTVESLAGIPETTSHVECTADERKALGIPEGLVRYSAGIEDAEDLINDLKTALSLL